MSLFSLRPYRWSDEIKPENHNPFFRCFDNTGRRVGYVRQHHATSTAPMYNAIVCHGTGLKEERVLAPYDTVENAKAAVERALG